ncbi:hypothetical protein EXIGLDRAFT_26020 [Exidia glandulosa HHB12029]|uniref:F-box domain-containing protein n=1 Tax=Exidia glandulosa HHB12029 TaxID=1314781 RepID=A0A165R3G5_EXIGL|nr:hypothetical protein EXIGLDRAFT_26020 [Exidia glandulosa HHB12029]
MHVRAPRITAVPSELVCAILEHLQFKDRLRATHTCRKWRTSASEYPSVLWSYIVSRGRVPGALSGQLSRSQGVPVSVLLTHPTRFLLDAMLTIGEHLHHIRALIIDTPDDLAADEQALGPADPYLILHHLRLPAPLLELLELTIEVGEDPSDSDDSGEPRPHSPDVIPSDIFGGHAPRLTHLALTGNFDFPERCDAFQNVSHLVLFLKSPPITAIEAIDIVFPGLEHLLFDASNCDYVPPEHTSLRLKSLSVVDDYDDPLGVLRHFRYETVPNVVSGPFDNADWSIAFTEPRNRENADYDVHLTAEEWSARWVVSDDAGRLRTVFFAPEDELVCPALWENITSFSINETFFYSDWDTLPPLPRVARLTLFLNRALSYDHPFDKPNIFHDLDQIDRPEALACPQLRVLSFGLGSTEHYTDLRQNVRLVLAPEDVSNCITSYVKYSALKLDEVAFHAVELLTLVPSQLCILFDLVDTVLVDDAPLLDVYRTVDIWHGKRSAFV